MKKISRGGDLAVYVPEPGDHISIDQFLEDNEQGITKDEFFKVLDKASQPIKRKPKSGSKQP